MLVRLLILLMLLPAVEIVLLVWVAVRTSFLLVLGLLLGSAALGTFLARRRGLSAPGKINQQVRAGRMPGAAMLDATLVSLAAVMLILPGFLTDGAALLLLFPPTRHWLKAAVRRRIEARIVMARFNAHNASTVDEPPRDEVIDVRVIESRPPR